AARRARPALPAGPRAKPRGAAGDRASGGGRAQGQQLTADGMADTAAFVALVLGVLLFAVARGRKGAMRRARTPAGGMTAKRREREARLRAIVDSEPDCVAILGLDERFTEINRAGLAMLEADTADAIIGRRAEDFIHPDDRALAQDARTRIAG